MFIFEVAVFFGAGLLCETGGTASPVLAPKSSMNSYSCSSRLLFQTMTTESLPPVVKKSPHGEKAAEVDAPSCPYKVYKICPCLRSHIFKVESLLLERRYLPFG